MPARRSRAPEPRSLPEQVHGASRARIAAIDEQGRVFVRLRSHSEAVEACVAEGVSVEQLRDALHNQQELVVVLEDGDPRRPIVLGRLPLPGEKRTGAPGRSLILEADADGRRVRLVAKDEIVLECGKASITMRRNGKVIVRGTHVETHSDGTNRIKGGQVKIN
jgi:hypothetical protein